jgi:outer membrane protein assembly factor BamA
MRAPFASLGLALLCSLPARPLPAQDTARVVRSLKFEGNRNLSSTLLSAAISTTNSSWFARTPPFRWIGLGEKRYFDEQEFRRDVLRLTLFYRQSGFLEAKVDTAVKRSPNRVDVRFVIREGPPVVVESFELSGLDSIPKREALLEDLPLRVGMPFNRFLFQETVDTVIRRLRDRGYPAADVLRGFDVDKVGHTARLTLEAEPGRRAKIGGVVVEGAGTIDTQYVRQLLILQGGDTYSEEKLFDSQRKLYQTELFRFATVGIDSAALVPDDTIVPLLVRVSQGKRYRIRSSLGYATNDCFRTSAGWTDRNLFGTGRMLDVSGQLSKIGVGEPFNFGLENSICGALKQDTIGSSRANYNVTVSIRQPRFLGSPRNVGTYSVFSELRSEYQVYRRDEVGGILSATREIGWRLPLTLSYKLSYGKTTASAVSYCAFFNACTPSDIALLAERRRLAVLSGTLVWRRSNNPLEPTRGHLTILEAAFSSHLIGSSAFEEFARIAADQAWYRTLGGGAVLSWRLRGGLVFSPKVQLDASSGSFVPPEQRFYAGGPNDVRGYSLNELGPIVYVTDADSLTPALEDSLANGQKAVRFSPSGGNTLALANVELRVRSPIFPERIRLALFVDSGLLYQRGETDVSPALVRVTPGVGLRIATPLGPIRLDVGYNGYGGTPGPLYLAKSNGDLVFGRSNFVRPRGSGFKLHFAIGEPF